MGDAVRYDVVEVRKPERTAQGFLRADAVLTRTGVFTYRNPDGSTRREYRPPDEVFRADALASFEDAPLTVDHPARLLDAESARAHQRGYVKETPRRDGALAVARIVVTDKAAIDEVESGRRRAVSCGYRCDYDPTPGVTPDGERYDGIQKNIRGNHLALVPVGRAGPEATVRLDADDAVMVAPASTGGPVPHQQEIPFMANVKVRLDGVDYDAPEQLAQAISVSEAKSKKRIDELEAQVRDIKATADKASARADQAEADAKKAKSEREDALKPDEIQKRVKARVALQGKASEVLGAETKLDELTDAQIKRAVVEKLYPDAKARLDGASETYLDARYDAAVEAWDARPSKDLGDVRRIVTGGGGVRNDADERIRKAKDEQANAWKKDVT